MENDFRARLREHKRIVVKVGTTTLTHSTGLLNLQRLENISWVLSDLCNMGKEIILVSSGSIAVGTNRLGLSERPRDTEGKQAASAVGQAVLMQIYENFFMRYNQKVAQILLTKDVLDNTTRKANALNTFTTLLKMGVIPIVNENDTVSTEELGFSDNDELSASVAALVESDMLVLLSDIDGFYDSSPAKNPDAKLISIIYDITPEMEGAAGESESALGTGGMITKVTAAKTACRAGVDTIIAAGSEPKILYDIIAGQEVGTLFVAKKL